jgi:hypothetical protein
MRCLKKEKRESSSLPWICAAEGFLWENRSSRASFGEKLVFRQAKNTQRKLCVLVFTGFRGYTCKHFRYYAKQLGLALRIDVNFEVWLRAASKNL